MHWYEKNIMVGPLQADRLSGRPVDQGRAQPGLLSSRTALPRRLRGDLRAEADGAHRTIWADRAALEFRSLPPSARDQLVKELSDKIVGQESDCNCGNVVTPDDKRKPFDDVRVRKALFLAIDQWKGAAALSKIAIIKTVGGIVFPGSPLAATKEELQQLIGDWPDIEKSRAEAKPSARRRARRIWPSSSSTATSTSPTRSSAPGWSMNGARSASMPPEGGSDRPVVRRHAQRRLRRGAGGELSNVVNLIADVGRWLPTEVYRENYGYFSDPKMVDITTACCGRPTRPRRAC